MRLDLHPFGENFVIQDVVNPRPHEDVDEKKPFVFLSCLPASCFPHALDGKIVSATLKATAIKHNLASDDPICIHLSSMKQIQIKGRLFFKIELTLRKLIARSSALDLVTRSAALVMALSLPILYFCFCKKIVKDVSPSGALAMRGLRPKDVNLILITYAVCVSVGSYKLLLLSLDLHHMPYNSDYILSGFSLEKIDVSKDLPLNNLANQKVDDKENQWEDIISLEELSEKDLKSPKIVFVGPYATRIDLVLKRILSKPLVEGKIQHPLENRTLTDAEQQKLVKDICTVFCINEESFYNCWGLEVLVPRVLYDNLSDVQKVEVMEARALIKFMALLPKEFRKEEMINLFSIEQISLLPDLETIIAVNS